MLEFQEKRKIKNLLYSKVTLTVLIILVVLLLNAVWNVYKKQDLAKDNLIKTAVVFEGLQAREKMLSSEIERLKTKNGVEEEIREKYGLVKPGEEVIVVVDNNDDVNLNHTLPHVNVWRSIINWFK
jgi:cell division protein FtsB